ncbi:putative nucleotidyltransferase, ribonuclease H [Tanacetum coccineum]
MLRVTYGCIELCYWRSSNAIRTPDRIQEPEAKRDGKKVHGARKRDDGYCPLLENLETLFVGFEIRDQGRLNIPGKANVVADALSRKAEFAAITQAQFFLQDRIKEGLEHDPLAKKIISLAKDGKTRRFWLKGDMLFTKGDRLYVPKWGDLRRVILKECHDSRWAVSSDLRCVGIGGVHYIGKGGKTDVRTFGGTCLFANNIKIEQKKSEKSEGSGSIIVVMDRFLKYETFIAAPPDVTADVTAKLFFRNAAAKEIGRMKGGDTSSSRRGRPGTRGVQAGTNSGCYFSIEVEEILSDRTIRRRGVPSYKEYLIKWRDLPDSEASWEAEDLLWQFADEIKRYHEDGTTRTSRA